MGDLFEEDVDGESDRSEVLGDDSHGVPLVLHSSPIPSLTIIRGAPVVVRGYIQKTHE